MRFMVVAQTYGPQISAASCRPARVANSHLGGPVHCESSIIMLRTKEHPRPESCSKYSRISRFYCYKLVDKDHLHEIKEEFDMDCIFQGSCRDIRHKHNND